MNVIAKLFFYILAQVYVSSANKTSSEIVNLSGYKAEFPSNKFVTSLACMVGTGENVCKNKIYFVLFVLLS